MDAELLDLVRDVGQLLVDWAERKAAAAERETRRRPVADSGKPGEFIGRPVLLARLDCSADALKRWIAGKYFPRPALTEGGRSVWRSSDVYRWEQWKAGDEHRKTYMIWSRWKARTGSTDAYDPGDSP